MSRKDTHVQSAKNVRSGQSGEDVSLITRHNHGADTVHIKKKIDKNEAKKNPITAATNRDVVLRKLDINFSLCRIAPISNTFMQLSITLSFFSFCLCASPFSPLWY